MKRLQLLIFILLQVSILFGNESEVNHLDYYKKINHIEDLIAAEDFVAAEKEYLNLFEEYEPPFVADVMVAAQLSAFNKNYQNTIKLVELAFRRGVRKGCVLRLPAFNEFVKTANWNKLLGNYQIYRDFYYHSIDSVLLIQLCEMFKHEQENKHAVDALAIIESNYD